MADSTLTTLLENIRVNLNDTTNYKTLADALMFVEICDEWFPLPKPSPYAVIVPGSAGDAEQLIATRVWRQPVNVYIAMRQLQTPEGERSLLGTSAKEGLDTLGRETRSALARPSPYNNRKPTGALYVTQAGVLHAESTETEYMGMETDDETEASGVQVIRVEITYLISEAKYV